MHKIIAVLKSGETLVRSSHNARAIQRLWDSLKEADVLIKGTLYIEEVEWEIV